MVSIVINGVETPLKTQGLQKVTDLVELIKSSIDPEHMITNLLVNGEDMSEEMWMGTTNSLETSILEVETNTPTQFVKERLELAPKIIQTCYSQFRETRKILQEGKSQAGNQSLAKATNTLRAFFEWYSSILQLVPDDKRDVVDITNITDDIVEICNKVCQQQLYQSWWAVSQAIQNELEPKLDELEDFVRKSSSSFVSIQ